MAEATVPLYQPLDPAKSEIRVLEYVSFLGQSSLNLSVVSLNANPPFTALSYVWGDASVTEPIILNGKEFGATKNLFDALQRLQDHWIDAFPGRHPQTFRIWVDALCINQQDVAERNQQVQLMRQIYSTAELVFSWFGPDDEDIGLAFDTVNLVDKAIDRVVGRRHINAVEPYHLVSWMKGWPQLIRPDIGPANDWHSNRAWKSVSMLFKLPYWWRVWVVQEVVLAKSFVLLSGQYSLAWTSLFSLCGWIRRIQEVRNQLEQPPWMVDSAWISITSSDRVPWHNPKRIMEAKHLQSRPELLSADEWEQWGWQVMSWSHTLSATNPKDNIYGLLGLTNIPLIPDYSDGVSVTSVYVDYFSKWLSFWKRTGRGKELALLSMAGLHMTMGSDHSNLILGFPTWVPNYPNAWDKSNQTFEAFAGEADEGVFGPEVPDAHVTENEHLLVSGIRIGEITTNLPRPTLSDTEHQLLKLFQKLSGERPSGARGMTAQEAIFRAVFESGARGESDIIHDQEGRVEVALAFIYHFVYIDREFASEPLNRRVFELLGLDDSSDEAFNRSFSELFVPGHKIEGPWLTRLLEWNVEDGPSAEAHNRVKAGITDWDWRDRGMLRIGRGEERYLGVSRRDMAQPGDIVCVFKGSQVPVVLRKTEEDECWSLVGTCWVAGVMNGEVKLKLDDGSAAVERFEIR
ncbi:heterokaryon incompatibility protein 6, OR allele [Colletotrichum liriopes]|uniref:Heterokaryon incompatibility protein 6, OR allele n=1 Tax=Colletotrichum liriopes TaxID=708192 RepID=A0AA37GK78_9PEZI|nr:heterokaryon incompatibility protein 6, OR allele [Colletotrichum liriopes]